MRYAEAIDWLFQLNRFGMKLGLDNMRALVEAVGRPQARFESVLVAGTNGKGSTAAMLHSILLAAGRRAALYTSPHLVRAEERIRLDDRDIETSELTALLTQLRDVISSLLSDGRLLAHPTFFEVITTAALLAIARFDAQVAVLEVGLGGRLDATNVVDPALCVITGIDFDHTDVLGPTLASIAFEKAGILRPGVPGIIGEMAPEAAEAIRDAARGLGTPLVAACDDSRAGPLRAGAPGHPPTFALTTPVRAYGPLPCPLGGAHQVRNAVLAVRAAELLDSPAAPVTEAAIARGLARTRWPGRLEWVESRPRLLLDGAHNPGGCAALADHIASLAPRPVLLFGAMRDKPVESMLGLLLPHVRAAVFTRPPMERAADPHDLVSAAGRVQPLPDGPPDGYHEETDVGLALALARRLAGPEGVVLAAGSLFLVGAVKAQLEGGTFRSGESP